MANPLYEVLVCDAVDERNARISLPFPPFPGLLLQAPWDSDNWYAVGEVYWEIPDSERPSGQFVIYEKRDLA